MSPQGKHPDTLSEFREMAQKSSVAKLTFGDLAKAQSEVPQLRKGKRMRGAKYNNEKVGGYDSRKEYYRAQQLKLMLKAGLISDLREQVSFTLIPAQYGESERGSKKTARVLLEHACRYVADFVYVDNATGRTVVEDTKGFRTPEYIIKRKLMLQVHGITIKEI